MAARRFPAAAARPRHRPDRWSALVASVLLLGAIAAPNPGRADDQTPADKVLSAVMRLQAKVPEDARTARYLGTERDGSGVAIDSDGLVLTAGYLIAEAESITLTLADGRKVAANPVAYDNDSGFGLVRATEPLKVKPIELGDSGTLKVRDRALVASFGGADAALPALVVSRRTFAGYWEYLLQNAIFTVPPHPAFSGAALIAADGKLVGIGSLAVGDAAGGDDAIPGNMFIPINRLKPILADLLEKGRAAGPKRPWLGINSQAVLGRIFVTRVTEGGPAAAAGIKQGDLVLGIGGRPVTDLEDFYRRLWASGEAGAAVPLDVLQGVTVKRIEVKSADRHDFFKTRRSY
jgi:S1-C subfamily serine protease